MYPFIRPRGLLPRLRGRIDKIQRLLPYKRPMEQDGRSRGDSASVAMTALKAVVAVVFIGGMTFALIVGYAHFDEPETPQFEKVGELRSEVVNNWENPGPNHDQFNRTEIERLVFKFTNEERAAEGLDELEYTDEFVRIARGHSADMANHGYVGHVDSQNRSFEERMEFRDREDKKACMSPEVRQRVEEIEESDVQKIENIPNPPFGENAGATLYEAEIKDERTGETVVNKNEEDIARSLVNSWMTSPAHRENILREKWESISIGVYVSEGKTVFATQLFCGYPEGSFQQIPDIESPQTQPAPPQ